MQRDHSKEKMHHGRSNENPLEGKTEEAKELLRQILGENDKKSTQTTMTIIRGQI